MFPYVGKQSTITQKKHLQTLGVFGEQVGEQTTPKVQISKLFTPLIKDLVFFWPFLAFFVDFRDFEPFVAILGGTSLK